MSIPSLLRGRRQTGTTDARATLTPQMAHYASAFSDAGTIRWVPYLLYFHPPNHRSRAINTDGLGFRMTSFEGRSLSPEACEEPVANLLAGSSTVFGIGATCDEATMASRLNDQLPAGEPPWLNVGGRSHNSAQELILHTLTRHRLPRVERVVLYSGFNDLGLARLRQPPGLDSGSFFLCNAFHEALNGQPPAPDPADPFLDLDEQIALAANLVLRHLDAWRALTAAAGTKLTYALQPLASWVRDDVSAEEEALFAQLDEIGGFGEQYGDICDPEVGGRYAALLREGCHRIGVDFIEMAPLIAAAIEPDDWFFVDRIHYTDFGYDTAARLLIDAALD